MGSADDDFRVQRYANATVRCVSKHCQFKQKGFFNLVVALSPPQHRRFIELDAPGGSYGVDPSTITRNST